MKPVAALTRLPNGRLVATDDTQAIMEAFVREAETVAGEIGIDLPDANLRARVVETCRAAPAHRSSMLRDVLAERKTKSTR